MKLLVLTTTLLSITSAVAARDNIQVAGSSTVLPYASIVAEAFGDNFGYATPVVESGGSGSGQKRLCSGIGLNTIDIANSSSIMTAETREKCIDTIGDIAEIRFGYDGIVFASRHENAGFENLSPVQLYKGISAHYTQNVNWKDVDSSLPDVDIKVYLPGTKHGTREVFEKKVMLAGCKATGDYDTFYANHNQDKKAAQNDCYAVRTDGVSIDIDGDYTETLANLASNLNGIGVFGLSFLLNNQGTIYAARINGIEASSETVANGTYPISRPLQFYVKLAHLDVIPGLREYISFFISDDVAGPDGPLAEYGLVSDPELAETQKLVASW